MAISCNTEIAINNYNMPETFIVFPTMTDEEILQGIDSSTRFVVVEDHTNTEPTGGPLAKEYLAGKEHFLDQLIKEYTNCIFILDNHRSTVQDCKNMIWCPVDWMLWPSMMYDLNTFQTNWSKNRKYTTNYIGGKNRINRILLEHWLAKNYPLDQLTHTKQEDSDLGMIEDIIMFSKFAEKKHIRPRKNLAVRWLTQPKQEKDTYATRRFNISKHMIISELKMQSYLALNCEPQDINLNTTIGTKTWESMIGGNLIIQFGNYRINEIYKKLGLEFFEHCFDHSHTQSADRYYQTIGGCENNKEVICDHDAIESLWHENIPALEHNFQLAKDINHWFKMFEQPMRILSDALKLTTNAEPGWTTSVPVDRFRYEFKL